MSDLPDLDTSQISFVAYWNAIDDGDVAAIDPEDMLSNSNIQSHTLYDNGFEAQYKNPQNGRVHTVRAKTDGWIVAYYDRTTEFVQNTDNSPNGFWDIIGDAASPNSLTQNSLERAINDLSGNLSNAGSINYNPSDVGLYDYQHDATNITVASDYCGEESTTTAGLSYTSDTSIKSAVLFSGAGYVDVNFDGTMVSEDGYTSYDLLANNHLGQAGTEYTISMDSTDFTRETATASVIILWS